ncbi:MAG: hypothetical protein GTO29_08210 [Candidatus Latescibacteria bacterium]|nr:hypothetical protein [Candidatus Latescibacterota bacterium]NIO56145.1 hypothetical protein [Candidatus Latescibacterota bacterium]
MKRVLLLAVFSILIGSVVTAQPGSIGLFADPGGTTCDVYDEPGTVTVYVLHLSSPGATGSCFRVDWLSWGVTMMYMCETVTPPYLSIGSSDAGIAIAYGSCVVSPHMILAIQFCALGTTPPCSYIQVVADTTYYDVPGIWVRDCGTPPSTLRARGGDAVINPDATCYCDVPVEETSWGRVKLLYR